MLDRCSSWFDLETTDPLRHERKSCHWLNQNLCCGCARHLIVPILCDLFLVLTTARFLLLYFVNEKNFSRLVVSFCVLRLLTTVFSHCFCLIAKPVGCANAALLLHQSSCGALQLLVDTSSTLLACVFYVPCGVRCTSKGSCDQFFSSETRTAGCVARCHRSLGVQTEVLVMRQV